MQSKQNPFNDVSAIQISQFLNKTSILTGVARILAAGCNDMV